MLASEVESTELFLSDGRRGRAGPRRLVARHHDRDTANHGPASGARPEQIIAVAVTSQWAGTVPVDEDGNALGPSDHLAGLPRGEVRARGGRRLGSDSGLRRAEARELDSQDRRGPEPRRQRAGRAHLVSSERAAGDLRSRVQVHGAEGLSEPTAHREVPGHDRLDRAALGDEQSRHRQHPLRRQAARPEHPAARKASRPEACGRRDRDADTRHCGGVGLERRHQGRRRHAGRARSGGGVGRGRGLRGPHLRRNLVLADLPRPVQEDRPDSQHGVAPFGAAGPLLHRQRARNGGRVHGVAARQRALPRRCPRPGRPTRQDAFERFGELAAECPREATS